MAAMNLTKKLALRRGEYLYESSCSRNGRSSRRLGILRMRVINHGAC